jgi:general secretion pathway protein F
MRFKVRAINAAHQISELTLDVPDAAAIVGSLRARGLSVLSWSELRGRQAGGAFPLVLFCQELLALLTAGIPLTEAIATLAEKESRAATRSIIESIATDLREGLPFSASLEARPGVFPDLFVALVRAAERTSDLDQALARFIAYREQLDALRSKLIGAAIYPVMLLAVGALVILFLIGYVVPRFARVFEDLGRDMPWSSRILLDAGSWVGHHGGQALGLFVALLAAVIFAVRQPSLWRVLGRLTWQIPGVGERIKVFQLARFYRTLGMLLRGGIPAVTALGMTRALLSPVLRPALERATVEIREGRRIADSFAAQGLTTPVATRMLATGERAGNLGDMLERTAAFHEEEIARATEWLTKLIGPVLMLFIGGVIGVIVVLMYLPIFQLSETLR